MDLLKFRERSETPVGNLVPPLWSLLRKNSDPEAKALLDTETFFNKIYEDIQRVYRSLDLQTCDGYTEQDNRSIVIRRFKDGTDWTARDSRKKTYLINAGFVQVSGDNTKVSCGLSDAAFLRPEGTPPALVKDTDFFFDDNTLYFMTDPFSVSKIIREGYILTPWKERINYQEITLEGSGTVLIESDLFNVYGFVYPGITPDYFNSTELYRVFLTGLYNVMYRSATQDNINTFAAALAGTPFIKTEGETVTEIVQETVDGQIYNVVVTDGTRYFIRPELPLSPAVIPGRKLARYTPVAEYVTVYSYDADPEWIHEDVAGDTLIKSDHDDWYQAYRLPYDLVKGSDAETLERFDMGSGSDHRPGTLASGLWHTVVGPLYYRFYLRGYAFNSEDQEIFTNILRELLPLDIIFDVVTDEVPEGALYSSDGKVLTGSDGRVLLGTDI